jgi:hypothetical protein
MNKVLSFLCGVCTKIGEAFNGTTINADTGVVEQHRGSVSRPSTGIRHFAAVLALLAAIAFAFEAITGVSLAQTDITSTVSSLSTLWDTIETLAIGIILFVLGRKLLRKV